ncbi:MAG: hypothetical protein ACFFER_15575, partial [Candidatus Thorarchaeota archaeon]
SDDSPPDIRLVGFRVHQKDKDFYVVKGSAQDIDRLCRVPWIDFDQSNLKHAEKAISPTEVSEWQRPLDLDRVDGISRFFQDYRNYLVNAVVISIPANLYEKAEFDSGHCELMIKSTQWMKTECPLCGYKDAKEIGEERIYRWFDRCPNHGCDDHKKDVRLGLIIDGQHRVRGTQGRYCAETHKKEQMVATLLPEDQFPPTSQAKTFTEITTTAEGLETSHKIYLLYKFALAAPRLQMGVPLFTSWSQPMDFRQDGEVGPRNRRAYQIACRLCMGSSPWKDMISILKSKRGDYIEIEFLAGLISSWMENGRVLADYSPPRIPTFPENPVQELENYLRAVKDTWSSVWSSNPRSRSSILQRRGIFYVILLLFEEIANRITQSGEQRSLQQFKRELEAIKSVDWGVKWAELETPDKNRRLLLDFLLHKIETGNPIDLNLGIEEDPDDFRFSRKTVRLRDKSLSAELPISLEWERPFHAYRKAAIHVFQGDSTLHDSSTSKTEKTLTRADITGLDTSTSAEIVKIRITYSNKHGHNDAILEMKP